MIKPIIINGCSEISEKIQTLKLNPRCKTFVFDIHKTTFYQKDTSYTHDIEVLVYITFLIQHYNVVFLSFDGNDTRIVENNKLLNFIKLYKDIPRIFI